MSFIINNPTRIKSAGTKEKIINEFIGKVNSGNSDISIARMNSPEGWQEPYQTPEFDEITLVLKGSVYIKTDRKEYIVRENQLFFAQKGERVQYSTPEKGGAEYIAICLPAFSPDTVHRAE